MQALIESLPRDEVETLRREFQLVEPTSWATDLAHRGRWQDANEAFLRQERERGRRDMEHLMAAAGVTRPVSPATAADLVAAAFKLYLPDEEAGSVERLSEDCLRVAVRKCPVFQRIERNNWRGVTACGSWHRRQGWYEAMGIFATDSILSESKWGDEACEALIDFEQPPVYPLART
ncbi:MAG TPA: hypothetical protein VNN10_09975 [Dehalococcoidia bacterium]|nr:hypothetical protein [Dehalococcoidia bacterium]